MRKLNVLYMIWSLELGGAEKMVWELALNCDQTRFRPHVVCLNWPGKLAEDLTRHSIKVISLNKARGIDLSIIGKIIKVIKEHHIDIVHSHLWGANFWGRVAARLARVPVIIATEHSVDTWKKKFHFLIDRILASFTDQIVVVSENVKNFYLKSAGIPGEKLTVIHNAVGVENFKSLKTRPLSSTDCGFTKNLPLWAVIGRLIPDKDHHTLFRAIKILNEKDNPINLLVVGEGKLRDELIDSVRRMGLAEQIRFAGSRRDINRILHSVNGVVLSSRREGLPIILLEAMAAGCPVVATRVGGIPELVKDGKSGLLAEAGDARSIAGAISRISSRPDLARALGSRARERVTDNFSLDRMINRHQQLYQSAFSAKKIKVLVVIDNFGCGGAQRQIIEYAANFNCQRFELTVLSLSRDKNELLPELESLGVKTRTIAQHGKFSLPALFKVYRVMREGKYDIVNTYLFTADCYGRLAAFLVGVPVLITSLRSPDLWKRFYHYAVDRLLKLATYRYIVNARAIKDILLQKLGVPCCQIDIVSNGIGLKNTRGIKSNQEIKKELGIPTEAKLVGTIGRLGPEKNHQMFLEAASRILKKGKDAYFVIVGEGALRETLEQKARALGISGRVIFTGNRRDIADILNALDIFILTSHYEGCSNVILEAMAMAKPVVATNVGGNPELVEEGKSGFIVPDDDYRKMAEKVEMLLLYSDLRESMGRRGQEIAINQFSSERMAREIDSIYENLWDEKVGVLK